MREGAKNRWSQRGPERWRPHSFCLCFLGTYCAPSGFRGLWGIHREHDRHCPILHGAVCVIKRRRPRVLMGTDVERMGTEQELPMGPRGDTSLLPAFFSLPPSVCLSSSYSIPVFFSLSSSFSVHLSLSWSVCLSSCSLSLVLRLCLLFFSS